jgi:hypothetical protein
VDRSLEHSPQMMVAVADSTKRKKKKKKKKKKEGMLSKALGRLVLGTADAMAQLGVASEESAKKYRRKHEESRDKKRDGWSKDLSKNVSKATVEMFRKSAKAPIKLIKALVKKDKKKKKKEAVSVLVQPGAHNTPAS